MEKAKKIIVSIADVVALFALIFSVGRLVVHDIPTLIRGYEEVALEYEYEEDDNYMGIAQDKKVVTKSYKKPVSAGDAISMILENVVICVLSAGVFILYPLYKKYGFD